jgi:hypothetical protein
VAWRVAWRGVACGVAWRGVACGVAWRGVACGVAWRRQTDRSIRMPPAAGGGLQDHRAGAAQDAGAPQYHDAT